MTQTKLDQYKEWRKGLRYHSALDLVLDSDSAIINWRDIASKQDLDNIDPGVPPAVCSNPRDLIGVFMISGWTIAHAFDDNDFNSSNRSMFRLQQYNSVIDSNSLEHLLLEIFSEVVGCSQAWFDEMIRLDGERCFMLENIQASEPNDQWVDLNQQFDNDCPVVTMNEILRYLEDLD